MRNSNIISAIANVVTRFSVDATTMLSAFNAPQHWHLNACAGNLSGRDFGTDLLFRDLNAVSMEIEPGYLPGRLQPTVLLKRLGNAIGSRRLFQRLS